MDIQPVKFLAIMNNADRKVHIQAFVQRKYFKNPEILGNSMITRFLDPN